MQRLKWWLFIAGLGPALAFASTEPDHTDPVAFVLLGVTTIFFFAIIGRYTARRIHQPSVLGELLIGILIGNLFYYYGFPLAILLREGSSIFDAVRQILEGVPLNQAVTSVIPNANYAQQVISALSGPHGADFLKITYIVDIFSRYGVIFLLYGGFGKFNRRNKTYWPSFIFCCFDWCCCAHAAGFCGGISINV
jgi:hypothetical protein